MLFVCHRTVSMADVYQLEFLDTKSAVSFPLEEHHIARKNYATEQKCPHVVHFNVPGDWFETILQHQKPYSEGR